MNLSKSNILVTGAAGTGVGFGVCQALEEAGATIIINDLKKEKVEKAVTQFKNAIGIKADLTNVEEVEAMFEKIRTESGVIHGLVNNAGVGLTKAVHEITEEEYDNLYDVNMKAVWRVTKYFTKQLLDNETAGNIVNVSSVHAFASQPNYSTYASSKNAIEGFTRAIAYELGQYNIRCNAIAPGYVHAEQNLDLISQWSDDPKQWVEDFINKQQVLHRSIEPIDCGRTVAFLLSESSRSITGQTIYVDAGKTIMLFNKDYITKE